MKAEGMNEGTSSRHPASSLHPSSFILHPSYYPTSHDFITSANNQSQRFSVELVFLFEHARRQSLLGVVIADGNNLAAR